MAESPESTTALTDRDILIHILARVEAMWEELEEFRPLLALVKAGNGNGGPPRVDFIGVMQLRREARKARTG